MIPKEKKSLFNLFASDNFCAYNRKISNIIGLNPAILLSELLNKFQFFEKNQDLTKFADKEGGWFYLLSETIRERTSLSLQEQKTALKILVKAGLVSYIIKGLPAKRFFQLNERRLVILLENQNIFTIYAKATIWIAEIDKLDCSNQLSERSATPIYKENYKDTYLRKESEPSASEEFLKKEGKEENPPPKKAPPPDPSPSQAMRLAELLLSKILDHSPKFKHPNLEKWKKEMDLLLRIDKRSPEEIENVIRWATSNDFWMSNVLSPSSLRKSFDRLVLQLNGDSKGKKVPAFKRNLKTEPSSENCARRQNLYNGFLEARLTSFAKNPEKEKEIIKQFIKMFSKEEVIEVYEKKCDGTREKFELLYMRYLRQP